MKLDETAKEVADLIPRFSWQLMDEEQRDDLMENVVLPRYMQTTADGTNLGPTWWSEALGATAEAVRNRVKRLRAAQSGEGERSRAESNSRTDRAAVTLRDPVKAAAVLDIEDSGGSYIRGTYEFGYPAVSFHFASLEQRLTLLGLFDGWDVQDNGVAKVLSDGVLVTVFPVRGEGRA